MLSLEQICAELGVKIQGANADFAPANFSVRGVATLAGAKAQQISFFANSSYLAALKSTQASAVLLKSADAQYCPALALISEQPYADFARLAALFERTTPDAALDAAPTNADSGFIHPSAVIEPGANIAPSAQIGAQCFVSASAVIGDQVQIGAQGFVGPGCVLESGCQLMPRVTLVKRVRLGARVRIHSGAVLGADGFGFAPDPRLQPEQLWRRVPQLGGVEIGADCDIGANTTIDCGAIEDTVLGRNVILDNQIQVGHNVHIGDFTAVAGCTAIAGSAVIGKHCQIAGAVGIAGHLQIADGSVVMAMSLVASSIDSKGVYAGSMPLMSQRDWRKNAVHIRRLDETLRKSRAVGDKLDTLPES